MVPIVEELNDATTNIENGGPAEMTQAVQNSVVKMWVKQEQVKRHEKLLNLKNNKDTLYGVVWGQCSTGLQKVTKGDQD